MPNKCQWDSALPVLWIPRRYAQLCATSKNPFQYYIKPRLQRNGHKDWHGGMAFDLSPESNHSRNITTSWAALSAGLFSHAWKTGTSSNFHPSQAYTIRRNEGCSYQSVHNTFTVTNPIDPPVYLQFLLLENWFYSKSAVKWNGCFKSAVHHGSNPTYKIPALFMGICKSLPFRPELSCIPAC